MKKTSIFFCCLIAILSGISTLSAANLGTRSAVLYEFEEWSVSNNSASGNKFDLVATVTFNHSSSSASHTTEMFHTGGNTWKFRFTPTKPGTWTFSTSSSDGDLNGHTGTVNVSANPDADATGFVKTDGNKYAIQKGPNGDYTGFIMNIMNGDDNGKQIAPRYRHTFLEFFKNNTRNKVRKYAQYAKDHGMNSIYILLSVTLNDLGRIAGSPGSANPDLSAFDILDEVMDEARKEKVHIHFWRWGDDERAMSSKRLSGGTNGSGDRRITRYLAARIGPLASWTMGYGFDLHEWVNSSQLNSWNSFFNSKLGFPHPLSARSLRFSSTNQTITGYAQGDSELGQSIQEIPNYDQIRNKLNGDKNRAHLLEERNILGRWGINSRKTRELMWNLAMAGGMGGWFGYFGDNGEGGKDVDDPIWDGDNTGGEYNNANALEAHRIFWENRFDLSYSTANNLSSTGSVRVLKSSNNKRYIFYKQNTSGFNANLSGMSGSQQAIAVDTKKGYQEVSLGTLSSSNQTISLPYSSDWVVAIGSFGSSTPPPPTFSLTVNSGSGDGNFIAGSTVNISANNAPNGQVFDKWTGNVSGIANVNSANTTITMPSSNVTITATYKVDNTPKFNLTVNSGSGDGSYSEGAVVNISADTPPSGQIFDQWTGSTGAIADVNSPNTTVTMPANNITVTATYVDIPVGTEFVKVNFQPNGSTPAGYISDNGAAFGNRNGFSYGWLGGSNGNTRIRSGGSSDLRLRTLNHLEKSGDRTWEIGVPNGDYLLEIACGDAEFPDQVNNLSVEGIQVSDPDGQDNFDTYNLTVTVNDGRLTIAPGNGSQNAKICYIDISFAGSDPTPTFDLTVNSGSGDGSYEAGEIVNISANAAPSGQEFDQWTGSVANVADVNDPTTTVTMPSSNITVTATYKDIVVPTFNLTVNSGSGDGSYEAGEVITISANAAPSGQEFDVWTGNVSGVANVGNATTTITMPASNVTVSATYKDVNVPTFVLEVLGGSGDGNYTAGTVVSIVADPAPAGQMFDKWVTAGGLTGVVADENSASTTVTMPASYTAVTATYKDVPTTGGPFAKINFQPSGASTPSGYAADGGSAFGNRGNGFSYGWLGGANNNTRNRSGGSDARLRTLNHMQKGAARTWEIAVPNGDYELEIGCGDLSYSDQINTLDVEGVQVVDTDGEDNTDIFTSIMVTVTDGRLTIKPGSGAQNAKICYVDINTTGGITPPPPPPAQFTLTVSSGSGDGNFESGTVVNISANAAPAGQEFDRWTGSTANVANVNNANTTVTMPSSNITVTATYKALPPSGDCASVDFEIEGEASGNTLSGTARFNNKSASSGGIVVGFLGKNPNNSLTINNINVPCAGDYQVEVFYISGATRPIFMSANGGPSQSQTVNSGNWETVDSFTKTFSLNAGDNSLKFFNNNVSAPDIDKIRVTGTGNAREFSGSTEVEQFGLTIFPNPSQGVFNLKATGLQGKAAKVSITDVHGRLLNEFSMTSDATRFQENLTPGIYMLHLSTSDQSFTKRLIIQ